MKKLVSFEVPETTNSYSNWRENYARMIEGNKELETIAIELDLLLSEMYIDYQCYSKPLCIKYTMYNYTGVHSLQILAEQVKRFSKQLGRPTKIEDTNYSAFSLPELVAEWNFNGVTIKFQIGVTKDCKIDPRTPMLTHIAQPIGVPVQLHPQCKRVLKEIEESVE